MGIQELLIEMIIEIIWDKLGVKIFTAEIIYHLFDQFTAYMEEIRAARRAAASQLAVFPCTFKLLKW